MITWSVTGGADQVLFMIGEDDGILKFNTPPDYEGPVASMVAYWPQESGPQAPS